MTRAGVITEIYRSLRDAFNSLDNVVRAGNSVIIEKGTKKAKISFRIKIEDQVQPEKIETP